MACLTFACIIVAMSEYHKACHQPLVLTGKDHYCAAYEACEVGTRRCYLKKGEACHPWLSCTHSKACLCETGQYDTPDSSSQASSGETECRCARVALAAAAADFCIALSHNSITTASTDFLADGRICLLPLYEGVPAQLPVPPIVKVGLSSCCVVHPVTYVVQEPGTAGHFRCWGRQ